MSEARPSYTCPKCHATSYNPHDIEQLYCGACHTFAQSLRDEEVTEFRDITKLHLTRRDCFSLAALSLLKYGPENPEARLVHGFTRDSWTGRPVQHAWCELPAIATYEDGSSGPIVVVHDLTQLDERCRLMPLEQYYRTAGVAEAPRHYTRAELITKAIQHGHDGPWDLSPDPSEAPPKQEESP